jgi:hypothetical protein
MEFLILVLRSVICLLVGGGTMYLLGLGIDLLEEKYRAFYDILWKKEGFLLSATLFISMFTGLAVTDLIVRLIK